MGSIDPTKVGMAPPMYGICQNKLKIYIYFVLGLSNALLEERQVDYFFSLLDLNSSWIIFHLLFGAKTFSEGRFSSFYFIFYMFGSVGGSKFLTI